MPLLTYKPFRRRFALVYVVINLERALWIITLSVAVTMNLCYLWQMENQSTSQIQIRNCRILNRHTAHICAMHLSLLYFNQMMKLLLNLHMRYKTLFGHSFWDEHLVHHRNKSLWEQENIQHWKM